MTYRNYLIENAKAIMMFFVVLGHFIEPLTNINEILKIIYLFIYSFHMPAFALIAGMVSKTEISQFRLKKLIRSLIVPLIAFTILYEIYEISINGSISNYTKSLYPYWHLWFLLSLFCWHLLLCIIDNIRYPIYISIIIGIAAGYFTSIGYFFGISRTLYFFPFFLFGHYFAPKIMSLTKTKLPLKRMSFIILIFIFTFFVFYHNFPHQWLYGSYPYTSLSSHGYHAGFKRLSFYCISIISVFSILFLLPRKKGFLSAMGQNSLYVYVWHGFIIKSLIDTGTIAHIGKYSTIPLVAIAILISILVTFTLFSNFVSKATQRFIRIPFEKILLKNNMYL